MAVSKSHHSPVVLRQAEERAASMQLRVADGITAFAGSMKFVYINSGIFLIWCGTGLFGFDKYPFQFLTMIVSLEAILLSAFVMIGQNRSATFQQAKADHDYQTQEQLLSENTDLERENAILIKEIADLSRSMSTKLGAVNDSQM